jgi:cadmium resistance protein CadD (predicted permease)
MIFFADHYDQNWEIQLIEIIIGEYVDFIKERISVFKENEMITDLLSKEKRKNTIIRKGNLSASGLDKLSYTVLKYEENDVTNLLVNIMDMMLRVQKCP